MKLRLAIALLTLAGMAAAQTNPAAQAAPAWRETHERAILGEFTTLLALPNLARDTEGIRRNAAAVSALLEKRGVRTRITAGGFEVVALDTFANALQVFRGGQRPTNLHQG